MHHTNPLTEEPLFSWEEPPQLTPAPLWRRIMAGVVDAVGAYVFVIFFSLFVLALLVFTLTFIESFRRDTLPSGEKGPLVFKVERFNRKIKPLIKDGIRAFSKDFFWLQIPVLPFITSIRRISYLNLGTIVMLTLYYIVLFFIATLYSPLFDSSRLQGTPGKWLFRLKVSDESGQRLTVKKAFLRSTGKMLTFATLGIGFISLFSNIKRQTWYDKRFKAVVTSK